MEWTNVAIEDGLERSNHGTVLHDMKLWIFGGNARRCCNDYIVIDLCDMSVEKYNLDVTIGVNFSVVKFGTSFIFFGGCRPSHTKHIFNDIYRFNSDKQTFIKLEINSVCPSPRYLHTCDTLDETRMILYGGRNENQVLSDIWVFDTETEIWLRLSPDPKNEQEPKPRAGHTLTKISPRNTSEYLFLMYGGWDGSREETNEIGAEEDLWLLSISKQYLHYTWTEIFFEERPPGRDCHVSIFLSTDQPCHRKFFVIQGGTDANFNYLNDMHLLALDDIIYPKSLYTTALMNILSDEDLRIQYEKYYTKESVALCEITKKLTPSVAETDDVQIPVDLLDPIFLQFILDNPDIFEQ